MSAYGADTSLDILLGQRAKIFLWKYPTRRVLVHKHSHLLGALSSGPPLASTLGAYLEGARVIEGANVYQRGLLLEVIEFNKFIFLTDVIYERFYFIAFSLMIDHLHEDREEFEKAVPCEVSICEYSIDQGIERVMHRFINPGKNFVHFILF